MSATFSACGLYRYTLTRSIPQAVRWVKPMLFVMLNPSTADASLDDPTIRRCIAFAKREGATHLTVVNLFALRSTDPKGLLQVADPLGPENMKVIEEQCRAHAMGTIVLAWGAHKLAAGRDEFFRQFAPVYCLGKTKHGAPRHPLYVRGEQDLIPYFKDEERA